MTSKYSFDIANELLNFGQFDIDLKKIIGSTNQYNPENDGSSSEDGTGSNDKNDNANNDGNSVNNNTGIGTGTGVGPGDVINNNDTGNVPEVDDIISKVKMTSIIRVTEGLNQIDVDYVIYDPYNEYGSVYVEVVSPEKIEVVYLSKNDTHVTLNNLTANTNYKLNFIYTTVLVDEETGEEEYAPYTFEQFELRTKMPEYSISVYKISKVNNTLTYKVNLQNGFSISKVNVNLSFEYEETDGETSQMVKKTASLDGSVDVLENSGSYVLGSFNIADYDIAPDTLLKLTIKSVVTGESELPVNEVYTFRFGR